MPIPTYQELMTPILNLASDGAVRTLSDYEELVVQQFKLTEEERSQMLDSGRQRRLRNRVNWAISDLTRSGLMDRTGRGVTLITEQGRRELGDNPGPITRASLKKYPEFTQKDKQSERDRTEQTRDPTTEKETPDELLESNYTLVRHKLAQDIIEQVMKATPIFFEKLVVDLLVAMGYGGSRKDAGETVGQSGDGGIDGVIKEDRLGLDLVLVQAKRYTDAVVGRPAVQAFVGSLEGERARKGVFITTSSFSKDAQAYVKSIGTRVVLIDGEQLAEYMIDFGVGVTDVVSYHVKRVDIGYFGEE